MKISEYKKRIKTKPRETTLCFFIQNQKILLAMKKRGFGEGKWNGSGGKREGDEEITKTVRREAHEEIDAIPVSLEHVAIINFYFVDKPEWNQKCYVFLSNDWDGTPQELEEMAPKWFKLDEIPYENMWESDKLWLPLILKGKKLEADILFDENQKLIESEIREISRDKFI